MSKWSTRQIATAAIIAALYTVMSLLSSIFGLTYGPIQCRFSEALTVLPFFLPEAVPGLFVGCLVTNLMSTVGPLDIIFGSMATLLAALWTAKMPNKFLATLPPVICNAVIIGAMIAWGSFSLSAFRQPSLTHGAADRAGLYLLLFLLLRRRYSTAIPAATPQRKKLNCVTGRVPRPRSPHRPHPDSSPA